MKPILIEAKGATWDAWVLNDPATKHDLFLIEEIKKHGGPGKSDPDGLYFFSIEEVDADNEYVSLEPVPEDQLEAMREFIRKQEEQQT